MGVGLAVWGGSGVGGGGEGGVGRGGGGWGMGVRLVGWVGDTCADCHTT